MRASVFPALWRNPPEFVYDAPVRRQICAAHPSILHDRRITYTAAG